MLFHAVQVFRPNMTITCWEHFPLVEFCFRPLNGTREMETRVSKGERKAVRRPQLFV